MPEISHEAVKGLLFISTVFASFYVCVVSPKGVAEDFSALKKYVGDFLAPITHGLVKQKRAKK